MPSRVSSYCFLSKKSSRADYQIRGSLDTTATGSSVSLSLSHSLSLTLNIGFQKDILPL